MGPGARDAKKLLPPFKLPAGDAPCCGATCCRRVCRALGPTGMGGATVGFIEAALVTEGRSLPLAVGR